MVEAYGEEEDQFEDGWGDDDDDGDGWGDVDGDEDQPTDIFAVADTDMM